MTFTLTATGMISRLTAQTTFTDSNANSTSGRTGLRRVRGWHKCVEKRQHRPAKATTWKATRCPTGSRDGLDL